MPAYRPEVPAHRRSALPGLLLVCRQITDEVETMLYGANTFEIMLHCGGEQDLERFSRERQAEMKRMLVILRPSGSSYNSDFRMNPGIWDSILANLSILEIITEQPRLANEWQEWTAWLTPILEHLARGLSSEAEIVVDTNRKAKHGSAAGSNTAGPLSLREDICSGLHVQKGALLRRDDNLARLLV
jgi:hypothetical protein